MRDDQQINTTQINLGMTQRNAAGDYHEYFVPGSIKLFLATQTKEELDRIALDNSRLFHYRFGFEPSKKAVRQQMLDIQNKYELTDREMRGLRTSGQMHISRTEAKLKPTRLIPIAGWIQLTLISLICIPAAFGIAFSVAPAWKQALGELAILGFWFAQAGFFIKQFIAPWRILKCSGAISTTSA